MGLLNSQHQRGIPPNGPPIACHRGTAPLLLICSVPLSFIMAWGTWVCHIMAMHYCSPPPDFHSCFPATRGLPDYYACIGGQQGQPSRPSSSRSTSSLISSRH